MPFISGSSQRGDNRPYKSVEQLYPISPNGVTGAVGTPGGRMDHLVKSALVY